MSMTEPELEASKEAVFRIAKQAADKIMALNGLTDADAQSGAWETKLFGEDGDPKPDTLAIVIWRWDGITEETGTRIPFTVEVRFGNLARGLCCDVVIGVGDQDDVLKEAHHLEVVYPDGLIMEHIGHVWQPDWFEQGLQDEDMRAYLSHEMPEDSIFEAARAVIERGRKEHQQ